ncbi:hypothetical protein GVO57_07355 [Sphingomonas changnyeongensis]|uniref:Uncharacterized protein n=1 Tax=Sphingomonas changnyeongensis TaxID=2698679 RepID=A0A7Z2NWH2_9SPHN|nr:hypothetical protein [Sphingomonas changnyeongensis]QHL90684.1 hypothetical protein GVO57_07355 [Sphingomonas changnyeongensis]
MRISRPFQRPQPTGQLGDPAPIIRQRIRECQCGDNSRHCPRCDSRGWLMPIYWPDLVATALVTMMAIVTALGLLAL